MYKFAFILIAVLLLGCITDQNQTAEPTVKKMVKNSASPAVSKEPCSGFSGYQKNQCIQQLAVDQKNPSLCERTNDGTLNEEITYKGACYRNYAIESKDVSLCTSLADKFYQNPSNTEDPVAYENDQISSCKSLALRNMYDNAAEQAVYDDALVQEDPVLCDNLKIPSFQTACYLNLAKTLKDPALCEKSWDFVNYCKYPGSATCKLIVAPFIEKCKRDAS